MEKNNKKFDAVDMMREIRDAMSAEMAGMNYEELKSYLGDRVPAPVGEQAIGPTEGRVPMRSSEG